MRPRTDTSVAGTVRRRIKEGGPGKLWTFADFRPLRPLAVAAALSRLSKEGVIRRVRRGVYHSPEKTRFGEVHADATEVAIAVFKNRGIEWKPSGPAAYNGLGLTTQVSSVLTLDVPRKVYLTTGSGKTHAAENLRFRVGRTVSGLSDKERVILDALREVHRIPDTSPAEAISRIKELLANENYSFNRLAARAALHEPPRVRALLGAIGSDIGASDRVLAKLKKTLNPITTFHVGVGNVLPSASEWHIQ